METRFPARLVEPQIEATESGGLADDALFCDAERRLHVLASELKRVSLASSLTRELHLKALGLKKALNDWRYCRRHVDARNVLSGIDYLSREVARARRCDAPAHPLRKGGA